MLWYVSCTWYAKTWNLSGCNMTIMTLQRDYQHTQLGCSSDGAACVCEAYCHPPANQWEMGPLSGESHSFCLRYSPMFMFFVLNLSMHAHLSIYHALCLIIAQSRHVSAQFWSRNKSRKYPNNPPLSLHSNTSFMFLLVYCYDNKHITLKCEAYQVIRTFML